MGEKLEFIEDRKSWIEVTDPIQIHACWTILNAPTFESSLFSSSKFLNLHVEKVILENLFNIFIASVS